MSDGWDESADAWIAAQAKGGDFVRQHILDAPMRARVQAAAPRNALDVGCGEGRFCRWMGDEGIAITGIDPCEPLLRHAVALDPGGDYRRAKAEILPFDDMSFDMVVCYLSLAEIAGMRAAVGEIARVLRPGGTVLIANLQHVETASDAVRRAQDGTLQLTVRDYFSERWRWSEWPGGRVRIWHRPMAAYFQSLLAQGLVLSGFEEPKPTGGPEDERQRSAALPQVYVMEWRMIGERGSGPLPRGPGAETGAPIDLDAYRKSRT